MEEGQTLSKRQLELEGAVKRMRAQLKAAESEKEKLTASAAAERADAEAARTALAQAQAEAAASLDTMRAELDAARQKHETALVAAREQQVQGGGAARCLAPLCALFWP